MNQTFIPDINFLREISFETINFSFKVKSETLFGRCFGDREFIPSESFKVLFNSEEILLKKVSHENLGGHILITYSSDNNYLSVTAYL